MSENSIPTILGSLVAGATLTAAAMIGLYGPPIDNQPPPAAPVVIGSECPPGWESRTINDHVVSYRCVRGSVVVVLYPNSVNANYGLDTAGGPDARSMACVNIPAWPAARCSDEE